MSNASLRVPSYRHHKPSGQTVVTVGGRDIYLGKHNSAASRAEYYRVIAEWVARDGSLTAQPNDLTIVELVAAFIRHAKRYYRVPAGKPTREVQTYNAVLRRLTALYDRTRAGGLRAAGAQGRAAADD